MKALVYQGPGKKILEERPIPTISVWMEVGYWVIALMERRQNMYVFPCL